MPPDRLKIDREALQAATDGRTFRRGEDYCAGGQVGRILESGATIEAKVRGTRPYRSKLWMEEGKLLFSCTCPLGRDGIFCKHCVALGLAWMGEGAEEEPAERPSRRRRSTGLADVRRMLAAREKGELVELIVDQAVGDDRLMRRLMLEAAKARTRGPDVSTYRSVIDEAVSIDGYVGYREAYDYARGIEEAVDGIEKLLTEGHAAAAVEMAEYALKAVEETLGSIDDSDGEMRPILERLQEIHHKGCAKARPDRAELARRLFAWELNSDWEVFFGAASTYRGVLGTEGLAIYRELAEAEWATVAPLGPGQESAKDFIDRFRITSIMETLARQTGDIEKLVAVMSRDLSLAYHYLQIAEVYRKAGNADRAVDWAERGVSAFPEHTDSRLREFLAEEYHRLNRHDDAMALAWAEFVDSPHLEEYRTLKSHADRCAGWPVWREKAFAHLRTTVAAEKAKAVKRRWRWESEPDSSTIVCILLWEKDFEAAWNEAQQSGCSEDLWLEMASKRQKEHPEDAIPIYQRQIEPTLQRKNVDAYHEAVRLLRKVHGLMAQLGREVDFTAYLGELRAAHRAKRNFMKLLDQTRWR